MHENNEHEVKITTYDRLMRAWENSMELVRDYEMYSKRINDKRIQELFRRFAEDEGVHAAELRKIIKDMEDKAPRS